jgi:hypothetical protein
MTVEKFMLVIQIVLRILKDFIGNVITPGILMRRARW